MRPRLTRNQRLLLTAGVAFLLYFVGLGRPALWEPDEGRYAEIPREMVLSGDFVTPRNNGVRYFEKPPLVYWAGAVGIKLFGSNEFAVRSQAAITSVGSVVVTQILAEVIAGEAVGFLAAAALGLSPLFFVFARFASPDPALAFFLTAALGSFYFAARGDFRNGASRRWMLLSSALLALGTLSKGPVALLLGGGIALLWTLFEGRMREILALRWAACVAVFLAITTPWFTFAANRNPGFLQFFFVHEHWQRYLESTEHGWGPWFFIPVVIFGTWPFIYFVPVGVRRLWRREAGASNRHRSDLRFLLLWFVVIFVFFSIPRSKLGEYVLPGIPPLAILAAVGLREVGNSKLPATQSIDRRFALISSIPLVLLGIAVISQNLGAWSVFRSPLIEDANGALGSMIVDAVLLALAFGIPALISLSEFFLGIQVIRIDHACLLAAAMAAVVLAKVRIDMPGVSYRELARTVAPRVQAGCALVSYHHFVQSIPFYTGGHELLAGYRGELAPFGDSDDVTTFISTDSRLAELWSGPGCVIVVANRSDLDHLVTVLVPHPARLACEGKKFALTNRPVPVGSPKSPAECLGKLEKP